MVQKPPFGAINGCWSFEDLGITWLISLPATKASEILRPRARQKACLWLWKFRWDA